MPTNTALVLLGGLSPPYCWLLGKIRHSYLRKEIGKISARMSKENFSKKSNKLPIYNYGATENQVELILTTADDPAETW